MTGLLAWRFATKDDRGKLSSFTCTTPSKAQYGSAHPKPWELDLQGWIRSRRPPLGDDTVFLIGEDELGIGAVSIFSDADRDPAFVALRAIAISARLRGRGGAHAAEALAITLQTIGTRARKAGVAEVFIRGRVDPRNTPSKRMCEAAGFERADDYDANLEQWTMTMEP